MPPGGLCSSCPLPPTRSSIDAIGFKGLSDASESFRSIRPCPYSTGAIPARIRTGARNGVLHEMTTPACSLCDAPDVRPRRHLISDENGRAICQSCVESSVRAYQKGGVALAIPPSPQPPNQCALCAGDTSVGATYRSDHGSGLCQACVLKVSRTFLYDDVPPETFVQVSLHRCNLCGKAHDEVPLMITSPPHGAVCSVCVDVAKGAVAEWRAKESAEQVQAPPIPEDFDAYRELVKTFVQPGLLLRSSFAPQQQDILVDWLAPRPDGRPSATITGDEAAQLLPTFGVIRTFLRDALAPVFGIAKQRLRVREDAPLAPEEIAALLETAIPRLLTPLGAAGSGPALIESFLRRFAQRIRDGATLEVYDTLPVLFGPELRDPIFNEHAADPLRDGLLINSLIRPTLTRLKGRGLTAAVASGNRHFVFRIMIEGAERSRGPVKLPYRIAVFYSQVHATAFQVPYERPDLLRFLETAIAEHALSDRVRSSVLGPILPVIERTVANLPLDHPMPRPRIRLAAMLRAVEFLLPVLTDDEKTWFLCAFFNLELPGLPPPVQFAQGQTYVDWFLDAVKIPSRGNPVADSSFQRALRLRDSLFFGEKLSFLAIYYHAESLDARMRLSVPVERPVRLGAYNIPELPLPADLSSVMRLRASREDHMLAFLDTWLSKDLPQTLSGIMALYGPTSSMHHAPPSPETPISAH